MNNELHEEQIERLEHENQTLREQLEDANERAWQWRRKYNQMYRIVVRLGELE